MPHWNWQPAGGTTQQQQERGLAQPGFQKEQTPAASHPNRFVWQWVDWDELLACCY